MLARSILKHSRIRLISTTTRSTTLPNAIPDIHDCLEDPDYIKQNLLDRKYPLEVNVVDQISSLERNAIKLRVEIQKLREQRNALSKQKPHTVKKLMEEGEGGEGSINEATTVKKLLKQLEPQLTQLTQQLYDLSIQLPNTSHPSSPIGDESKARVVKTLGPTISSPPPPPDPARDHHHLTSPAQLGWTDFPTASLVSGPSWPYLLREGALLEMALTNYAMSVTIQRGFTPVLTPDVIRHDIADRCGFRPREGDSQQTYFLGDGRPSTMDGNTLCLAGTAEIPLVAMSAATILSHTVLPLKHVALGRAFRAEAGARGADSRGLYRVHQFSKVEMVVVCHEEESDRMLEDLRTLQEEILGSLGLSLR
jgi:seryl-tRNA synthetase